MRAAATLLLLTASTSAALSAAEWKRAAAPLVTRWGREVTPENAWREYPRPQLVRPDWLPLNGLWQYRIAPQPSAAAGPPDAARALPPDAWDGEILVPFAVESALSGVGRGLAKELGARRDLELDLRAAPQRRDEVALAALDRGPDCAGKAQHGRGRRGGNGRRGEAGRRRGRDHAAAAEGL